MKYNILITTNLPPYNIMELTDDNLKIVTNAYNHAKPDFTLSGKKYWIENLIEIKIYTYDKVENLDNFKQYCISNRIIGGNHSLNYYFTSKCLEILGKDITAEIIGDKEFGYLSNQEKSKYFNRFFVAPSRIDELKNTFHLDYDLTKLLRFCEELNDNFSRCNYLSVVMIVRSILNHVPPIFSFKNFDEVANNYGGLSFKKNMSHLNNSLRNIADGYLHETIRKKEILPNEKQVNFSQDLDVLLAEIVRKLNEK